jgi:ABC-type antimicrobial peptide transport system permease subunit
MPLYDVRTMEARIDQSLVDRRTPMLLSLVFAGVALFLAGIGLYGVLAYQVAQRRREIGIRMALGSTTQRIFGMVVREGVLLLIAGFAAGLAGAFAIRRTLASQLYGIGPMDPTVVSVVAAILGAVALGAPRTSMWYRSPTWIVASGDAPVRSSAIRNRRGSGFSTPCSCESSTQCA